MPGRMAALQALQIRFRRLTGITDENGEVIGTYYIRTNQAGGGKHICIFANGR